VVAAGAGNTKKVVKKAPVKGAAAAAASSGGTVKQVVKQVGVPSPGSDAAGDGPLWVTVVYDCCLCCWTFLEWTSMMVEPGTAVVPSEELLVAVCVKTE